MGDILRLDHSDNYKVKAAEVKAIAQRDVAKYKTGKTLQPVALPSSVTIEPLPQARMSTATFHNEGSNRINNFQPVQGVGCSINAHPLESTLYDDSSNAKMMRILRGIEPSKLDQLILKIKDMFSLRKRGK